MKSNSATAAIVAAFERHAEINLHEDPIRVHGDEVITLEGEVANIAVKRQAERIARRLAYPTPVLDRLLLRVGNRRVDDALEHAVLDALIQETAFAGMSMQASRAARFSDHSDHLTVTATGSRVRLDGRVNSLSHRRLAEVIAWWIPGTADVDNRVRVSPPEEDNDGEICDAVRLVLDKETSLDADQVHVACRQGEITLTGVVNTEEQRRFAIYDCWYIPGVHAVKDQMHLRPH